MVTATPPQQEDSLQEQVRKKMPLVNAYYERPVQRIGGPQIRYAGLHQRDDVYRTIFNTHCPKIPVDNLPTETRRQIITPVWYPERKEWKDTRWDEIPNAIQLETGREEETDETYTRDYPDRGIKAGDPKTKKSHRNFPVLVPDPDVIWVGRISDGLVWLGVVEHRRMFKSIFSEIDSGPQSITSNSGAQVEFTFRRRGQSPVAIGQLLVDMEPGEIINSPTTEQIQFAKGSNGRDIDWQPSFQQPEWPAIINTDSRYGMHFLKRGDEIMVRTSGGWPKPLSDAFERRWVLRPPSEGSSFVPTDRGDDGVVRIGRAPRLRQTGR